MKVLHERYTAGPEIVCRFVREGEITGQLEHPGIPPVYGLGVLPDGRPFLAMKFIKGRDLQALLDERGDRAADRELLLGVFERVCMTVGYAHVRGVIHRDLRPGNVMVGSFGEVQVMDWGLAKVIEDPSECRADVFGLGAILCAILTGRADPTEAAGDRIARLDGCGAEVGLVALARRCLNPNPNDRPADAGEVAQAVAKLRQEAEERVFEARADHRAAAMRADERRRRRRLQVALAVAYGLLVLSWLAFGWFVRGLR